MKRSTTAVIVGVLALGLVGGGTAVALTNSGEPTPEASASAPAPVGTDATAEASTDAPANSETPANDERPAYITEPGEVCDPHNVNDPICAAFYPAQVILNMTSPERAREPLASMNADEKIRLAHEACENLVAGVRPDLVDTILAPDDPPEMADRNNDGIYIAASLAYCNEFAGGTKDYPDKIARTIAFYKKLGESAAKVHFADKIMPVPAELGY